jgi:hypothetical protein
MKTSFKTLVKFALLLCQIRCLTLNTDAFCFHKCHLIAIYSCVVQCTVVYVCIFYFIFRNERRHRDDCTLLDDEEKVVYLCLCE